MTAIASRNGNVYGLGAAMKGKVDAAKVGASTILDLKDKFERSLDARPDLCTFLDVSAICYLHVTGGGGPSTDTNAFHGATDWKRASGLKRLSVERLLH
jgi:hypothetical protein